MMDCERHGYRQEFTQSGFPITGRCPDCKAEERTRGPRENLSPEKQKRLKALFERDFDKGPFEFIPGYTGPPMYKVVKYGVGNSWLLTEDEQPPQSPAHRMRDEILRAERKKVVR